MAFLLLMLGAWDARAQLYAPVPAPYAPRPWAPPPTPQATSISDWGLATSSQSRVGLRSGLLTGPALAWSFRSSSLSGRTTTVFEAMEIAALTSLTDRRMGFRLAPFSFGGSFASESVYSNVYARWTLVDLGYDVAADGRDAIVVATSGHFGISHELDDDLAVRAELGPFVGIYVRERDDRAVPYFDVGGVLSLGLVIR